MEQKSTAVWHTLSTDEALAQLQTGITGLTSAEAGVRLAQFGPNKLQEGKRKSLISILLSQFADFMIWVLIGAALVSGLLGEWVDAGIILVVVILNAILGTIQESKAEAALEALKQMAAPFARVVRDQTTLSLPAADLVQGDIVALEAGDAIPADLRLLESASLKVEESALTGESLPVEKSVATIEDTAAALGDRVNMAHMGTNVTYGRGLGVVVSTGMDTQMGKIAGQLATTEKEITPLQKNLNQISNTLSIGVLVIAALIFGIGMLSGGKLFEMFMTAVSLAVAAIPEGMVAVVTIVLAMGMKRMAEQGAIIRRLPAVETLGSTQIICSDKTGTLTQNRMTVQKIWNQSYLESADDAAAMLLDAMGHCNDSKPGEGSAMLGDPTETALIDYLLAQNRWTVAQVRQRQRAGEIPFDSERKRSTVAIRQDDGLRIFVKGAPDVLMARCERIHTAAGVMAIDDAMRGSMLAANDEMAAQALRVLAFAYKDAPAIDPHDVEGTESGLIFCGLVGMIDPPRPEVRDAIAVCRQAGVLPVMITGDHKTTAVAIAEGLGMLSDGRRAITGAELEAMNDGDFDKTIENIGVYARVAPEHKSRIVNTWQKRGKIVAMTGDGVNDAPALKTADIGVGMGITGTDVSKGASDMVLTDDNFATIVRAVGEGRRIFDNIHKTVRFLLSSNAGEVLAILAATIGGFTLLQPVHILWVNLVTDTFPALALGVEPAESDIMTRPPRDGKQPFFSGSEWAQVAFIGLIEALLALVAYWLGTGMHLFTQDPALQQTGTTMAFLTLSLLQLFAAVGFQSERHSIFRMKLGQHPILWLAFFGSALLQLMVLWIPPMRNLFRLSPLNGTQYAWVAGLCLIMLLVIEAQKLLARLLHKE